MVFPNYKCSHADLYTSCRLIWLLCLDHLDKFAAYKSKYMIAFVNENLALIKTVESMPTYSKHAATAKNSFQDIGAEQSDASIFFKQLKGYIKETYKDDKTLLDAQITEAGQSNFEKISKGNWREMRGLYTVMIRFVENYQNDLMTKGYLPADFLTRLQTKQMAFDAAHQTYKADSDIVPDSSEAKIIANNDLKIRAMAVLADGQIVNADNKATAQKFVWATILTEVRGAKPTGLSGFITDADTKGPLSIATAHIVALDKTATTDEKGRYELSPLPIGTHAIEYKAEGYVTQIVNEKDIKWSVMGRLNIALVPIAKT